MLELLVVARMTNFHTICAGFAGTDEIDVSRYDFYELQFLFSSAAKSLKADIAFFNRLRSFSYLFFMLNTLRKI